MSGAGYEVVYRYADDVQNGGGVQHEIREYSNEKEKNGQYLDGERVSLLADRNRSTQEDISHYVVFRYDSDFSRGGVETHELRGYPDHSFADYANQQIKQVLTWRDLAVVENVRGLDEKEKYEIECQDDVDPCKPEIRNYGLNGEGLYCLYQLPKGSFYFHEKERCESVSREHRAKQPHLAAALDKAGPMTAGDVNIIRKEWQDKKQAWNVWWEKNQKPQWYLENEHDTQKDWHANIYEPLRSHITSLLQELYRYR